MKFYLKVLRNGMILASLFFFAIWAGQDELGYQEIKTLIIFLGTYIMGEFANYYRISSPYVTTKKKLNEVCTLVF